MEPHLALISKLDVLVRCRRGRLIENNLGVVSYPQRFDARERRRYITKLIFEIIRHLHTVEKFHQQRLSYHFSLSKTLGVTNSQFELGAPYRQASLARYNYNCYGDRGNPPSSSILFDTHLQRFDSRSSRLISIAFVASSTVVTVLAGRGRRQHCFHQRTCGLPVSSHCVNLTHNLRSKLLLLASLGGLRILNSANSSLINLWALDIRG